MLEESVEVLRKLFTGEQISHSGTHCTGDGKRDVLARDTSGVLWLYQGTGSATAPFKARTRIGSGWNQFTALVAPGDLTDDGQPDLLARDTSGVLWLYQGTGSATTPFKPRTRIGSGWNEYNALS